MTEEQIELVVGVIGQAAEMRRVCPVCGKPREVCVESGKRKGGLAAAVALGAEGRRERARKAAAARWARQLMDDSIGQVV
ncbi:MAG: hypothetical protein JO223_23550 [Hyphomicrobiales bacterium]|nr:hypothetical protein [Hyphomicrobiales bacterium]MBV8443365.1 hypothetical protein [Hyphomicrobiales bacterium]